MIALNGIPLMRGTAAGPAVIVRPDVYGLPQVTRGADRQRLDDARRQAQLELQARVDAVADGAAREILRAHLALADDPLLTAEFERGLAEGLSAEETLHRAGSSLAGRFTALADPALRARGADISDVCQCIARHLGGGGPVQLVGEGCIVCAAELSAAQVLQFVGRPPLAFVLETNVETSHAAILIRALGVPAVVGVSGISASVADGDPIVVDGTHGRIVLHPESLAMAAMEDVRPDIDAEPARTQDGAAIAVTAIAVDIADARSGLAAGADGIGLFRTEWLFLRTEGLPSEEIQAATYREMATLGGERSITMRVMDLGGDKVPPALRLEREPNPALGMRGVRFAFAHPDLLGAQLRALGRAFEGRRLRLLLPMVNDVDDVARMRRALAEAALGTLLSVDVGVMIETPAAALMADELAAAADFLSLGTNDLTQYVLAVDRESASVAALYQPLHPAVLRMLHRVGAAAAHHRKVLSVCGEAAADPVGAPLFIGIGATELSVRPAAVARVKRLVRRTSLDAARALVEELMALPTAAAVAVRLKELALAEDSSNVLASRDAE